MATIMFVPIRTAMQLICWLRLVLTAASILWLGLHSPDCPITGYLGDLVTSLLPGSTYLNLAIPGLGVEVFIDCLFLAGVGLHSRPWLVPWLVINLVVLLALLLTLLHTAAPLLLAADYAVDAARQLEEMEAFLRMLSLNMISTAQLLILSGGLKLFLDMRYRRRISFSKKIDRREISSKEDCANDIPQFPHPRLDFNFATNEEASPIFKCNSNPMNVIVTLDEEGSKSESWEEKDTDTIKFTYDENNFV